MIHDSSSDSDIDLPNFPNTNNRGQYNNQPILPQYNNILIEAVEINLKYIKYRERNKLMEARMTEHVPFRVKEFHTFQAKRSKFKFNHYKMQRKKINKKLKTLFNHKTNLKSMEGHLIEVCYPFNDCF